LQICIEEYTKEFSFRSKQLKNWSQPFVALKQNRWMLLLAQFRFYWRKSQT